MSMFTASAVGLVIAENACLAGAQGGCQAECGSAAAMAAAALVELSGGTPQMLDDAVAIALKSQLGLVCDPVAGLVEIPCIKRNAAGAAIAFMAAELALAGISSRIPADEVIVAMRRVGNTMSPHPEGDRRGGPCRHPHRLPFGANRCSAERPGCNHFPARPLTGAGFWVIFT